MGAALSAKSGIAANVISLPQGGGALQGIGERFSPDLHTGTGNLTVPLALPPGRSGLQPQLALAYSSGSGNGPFGMGWGLTVPGVTRRTSRGIPTYDDDTDTFLLSGAEDLVAVPGGSSGIQRYRPRTEGLFARIEHLADSGTNHWEVRTRDGLLSIYGTPRPTGADPSWRDPGALLDPNDRTRIFAWKLTETRDPFGNKIAYRYERDAAQADGPHHWDQLYLTEIDYVDYGERGDSSFLIGVKFTYEPRPDTFSDRRPGFEVRTIRRCTRIDVFTLPGAEEILVRTYHLSYVDPLTEPGSRPPNGVSLLKQIQVEGRDGDQSEFLPPLEFAYTSFQPELRRYQPFSALRNALPPRALGRAGYELVDLFANGLPDVMELNGAAAFWRNVGNCRVDFPQMMQDAPAGLSLTSPGVQLADINGDGRIELLVTDGIRAGYYSLGSDGGWDPRSYVPYPDAPSVNLEAPDVRLVDLDGDGVIDALQTAAAFELYYNRPPTGWAQPEPRPRAQADVFPDITFADPTVKLADMTGDGLQDIVLIRNGRIDYWPYLGYGRWGDRITMRGSPRFEDASVYGGLGFDPRRVLLGDVDGDGVSDFVYVGSGHTTLWINQGGEMWSDPITIHGTPPITDADSVRLADMNGIGTAGLLWTYDYAGNGQANFKFLDFIGGVKPYLLDGIDNHLGAVTHIQYSPSTVFYLRDQEQPARAWRTSLPFPVQVVSRVEAIDAISAGKLTTEYDYHHGYWDGVEREFRGFGRVDQRDTETFEDYGAAGLHGDAVLFEAVPPTLFSPPTETRTWFHQGPVSASSGGWTELDLSDEYWDGDPERWPRPAAITDFLGDLPSTARRDAIRSLRGRILRTELYALDGSGRQERPYTVTDHTHGVSGLPVGGPWPVQPEPWQLRVFFPFEVASRVTEWERGSDPMTRYEVMGDHDKYGQPGSRVSLAAPRGPMTESVPREPYLATVAKTIYAQRDDPGLYLVDRIARTTAYEVLNDGSTTVEALVAEIQGGSARQSVIAQSITYFDGSAFVGLPFGQLGDHGAPVRTKRLVLTDAAVEAAYSDDSGQPAVPPYLSRPEPSPWPTEYPDAFRTMLPSGAGYIHHDPGGGSEFEGGFYEIADRRRYDVQEGTGGERGLVTAQRDQLEHDVSISYDGYELLPVRVTDAAGLSTSAAYDLRTLKPSEVTDANGNRSAFGYTPLGLVGQIAVMGKESESAGDTPDRPSTTFGYSLDPYEVTGQPVGVRTIRRVHHLNDLRADGTPFPVSERDETIERVEYSDGFGRLVQTRAQGEDVRFGDPIFGDADLLADQSKPVGPAIGQAVGPDPPPIVVSGWQVYDNKGRIVERFEPFFSAGWKYGRPSESDLGQRTSITYDPRGRPIRTVSPDHSEQLVIYGVPGSIAAPDLSDPSAFEPTPWETYTYDANDNAGRTHPTPAAAYQHHWNTPASALVDALGRTVATTERNGQASAHWLTSLLANDIRGNLLTVTDPLGRIAVAHSYDLADRTIRSQELDGGITRTVFDAAGDLVERRNSKEALIVRAYDEIQRPLRTWARDAGQEDVSLRERFLYGDSPEGGLDATLAAASNLLGRLFLRYDEAGSLTLERYDFEGNAVEKVRQVLADSVLLSPISPPWQVQVFRVNWEPKNTSIEGLAEMLLDPVEYRTSAGYDALNRISWLRHPADADGPDRRKVVLPAYNAAGALESVRVDGTVYVRRIAYNAKGQRTLVAYGNAIMTRYTYHPRTFHLVRLRTEACRASPDELTLRPKGAPLQDYAYLYDLVGNILAIHDRAPGCGVPPKPDQLDRSFTYDPIYRLVSGTGRETPRVVAAEPWSAASRSFDVTIANDYTEKYAYDEVSNLLRLVHQAKGGKFVRAFAPVADGNRLATMKTSNTVYAYTYGPTGDLTDETTSRHFEWDHSDRMKAFRNQTGTAEPSVFAQYLYDPFGQRVKTLVRKQSGQVQVTVYVDEIFEHHSLLQAGEATENYQLHVMDGPTRVAIVRVGPAFRDDHSPSTAYQFGDHLGSSNVVVDEAGSWTNREEYSPFGETLIGSFALKRYRFTGNERDRESGLNHHGARYYAPWIARWTSCDAVVGPDDANAFVAFSNNPMRYADPLGRDVVDRNQPKARDARGAEPPDPAVSALDAVKPVAVGVQTLGRPKDVRFSAGEGPGKLGNVPGEVHLGTVSAGKGGDLPLSIEVSRALPGGKTDTGVFQVHPGHPGRGQHASQPHLRASGELKPPHVQVKYPPTRLFGVLKRLEHVGKVGGQVAMAASVVRVGTEARQLGRSQGALMGVAAGARAAASEASGWVGADVGGVGGAKLGAIALSELGPLGMAAGALAGGAIGGFIGYGTVSSAIERGIDLSTGGAYEGLQSEPNPDVRLRPWRPPYGREIW